MSARDPARPDLKADDGRSWTRRPNGQIAKGTPGGGRRHRIDLLSLCDRMARHEGHQLDDLVWGVVKGLMYHASKGNVQAAKILFDKLVRNDGHVNPSDTPALNVGVTIASDGAVTVSGPGPKLPDDAGALADYLDDFGRIVADLRKPRLTVESAAVVVDRTLNDLLGE